MRAVMSNRLRAFLQSPEDREALRRVMADMTNNKQITVAEKHYTVHFSKSDKAINPDMKHILKLNLLLKL